VELVGRELTEEIIGAAYAVHNELGFGFLEIDIGPLINFGKSVTVRRKFGTTRRKSC